MALFDEIMEQAADFRHRHMMENGSLANLALTLPADEYDRLVDEVEARHGAQAKPGSPAFMMYGVVIHRYPPAAALAPQGEKTDR